MKTKMFSLMRAGVAAVLLGATTTGSIGARAHAQSTGESHRQIVAEVPSLSGQWGGTATIFGEPLRLAINIEQAENAVTGSCSVSGLPASAFAITLNQQQGNLSGTYSLDGKCPRPFSGSLSSQGDLELTLYAGAGKHPNCSIAVSGMVSDDRNEIAGTFKSSSECKNQGQTGTFQIISQG